ncbi:MAG: arsenosugar biosynthesis radical SAM (seleno)protein ArsS [Gemmataceae bacterium]
MHKVLQSLLKRANPLSKPEKQRWLVENTLVPAFSTTLMSLGQWPIRSTGIETLQINLGKLCNQTCNHCHVDAGPDRKEIMTMETLTHCLKVLEEANIPTLDLTGGAPEMNPHFSWAVEKAFALKKRIIDRCNLTILTTPSFRWLYNFLAKHKVEIIASLPCYLEENTDKQRGAGTYQKSIEAIKHLNSLGYGNPESGLVLNLVFNPSGINLPPSQEKLEADYKSKLNALHGIRFNRLLTITNMPISRFLDNLHEENLLEPYMSKLANQMNPGTLANLMCRNTISVGWNGTLFDCDFNQMLDLPLTNQIPQNIANFDVRTLKERTIVTGKHCYGCTAGSGSSCQGAISI